MPSLGERKLFKGEKTPRIYAYNPSKNYYGFYSYKEAINRRLIRDVYTLEQLGFTGEIDNRARSLRENIISILELKASTNINQNLIYDAISKLNNMSDEELSKFGKENYNLIQHYFEYNDSGNNTLDMDARLYLLVEMLGINPLDSKYKNVDVANRYDIKVIDKMDSQYQKVALKDIKL